MFCQWLSKFKYIFELHRVFAKKQIYVISG